MQVAEDLVAQPAGEHERGPGMTEEDARRLFIAFPFEVRAAAAGRIGHEPWKSMTWVERLHALPSTHAST